MTRIQIEQFASVTVTPDASPEAGPIVNLRFDWTEDGLENDGVSFLLSPEKCRELGLCLLVAADNANKLPR
jgi:hypothetical protein